MPDFPLVAVSYVLLAIFVVAFLVRAVRMWRLPIHLRWELAPVPHEKGKGRYGGSYLEEYEWWTKSRETSLVNEVAYMLQEILLLKGVWAHNRRLWWFSFPLHIGLYLLIGAAVLIVLGGIVASPGASGPDALHGVIRIVAGAGYILGGVGALGLVVSRLSDARLRTFSTPASLLNLVFLLAVFVSGACALAASGDFAADTTAYARALLTADLSVDIPGALGVHLALGFLLLAYLPFTRMMHFVAKYFTYHKIRWDDEPLSPGGRIEREVLGLLKQPVTWSGPHLKADGKKNWVDIATEEVEK